MKLISRYNRVNLLVTTLVLLLSAVFYYFFVKAVLVHQLDKSLKTEQKEITDYVTANHQLPEPSDTREEKEFYAPVSAMQYRRKFSTVSLYDAHRRENVLFRQLAFTVLVGNQIYRAEVWKSQEETEDLVKLISLITLGMVIVLLVTLLLVNRLILNRLWEPFFSTLHQIRHFNLSARKDIALEPTRIDEFRELNGAIRQMTHKAFSDYDEIKNFTENASHEIQTPLAIIKSKLELLSQGESINENQMDIIESVSGTVHRLSKLNQSLILLTKLDNRQFSEKETVDIGNLLLRQLNHYEELLLAKKIHLDRQIQVPTLISFNEALAEILISNLLTNAIKHNISGGTIKASLDGQQLTVSNTGRPLSAPPAVYFERFQKDSISGDSLGLGLSIVKKICDNYNFTLSYRYEDGFHVLKVKWNAN
ncbi:MAG: HAMP domain-containing histidine kinase [Bacteroidota bacterium]|nr:HAMP domain-containing histidine kinase [Bacteroidota bacterium]